MCHHVIDRCSVDKCCEKIVCVCKNESKKVGVGGGVEVRSWEAWSVMTGQTFSSAMNMVRMKARLVMKVEDYLKDSS